MRETLSMVDWGRLSLLQPAGNRAGAVPDVRTWAKDRTLDLIGVDRSGFDLRRRLR